MKRLKREIGLKENELYTVKLLSAIRDAAGDPHGRLMQDELVEHIKQLYADAQELKELKGVDNEKV